MAPTLEGQVSGLLLLIVNGAGFWISPHRRDNIEHLFPRISRKLIDVRGGQTLRRNRIEYYCHILATAWSSTLRSLVLDVPFTRIVPPLNLLSLGLNTPL